MPRGGRDWAQGTEVGFYKSQCREGTDPTEDDLHQLLPQALLQNKVTCTRLSDVFHYVTPLLRTRSLAYPQDLTFSISLFLPLEYGFSMSEFREK